MSQNLLPTGAPEVPGARQDGVEVLNYDLPDEAGDNLAKIGHHLGRVAYLAEREKEKKEDGYRCCSTEIFKYHQITELLREGIV